MSGQRANPILARYRLMAAPMVAVEAPVRQALMQEIDVCGLADLDDVSAMVMEAEDLLLPGLGLDGVDHGGMGGDPVRPTRSKY